MLDRGDALVAVEAKSGQTVSGDQLRPLQALRPVLAANPLGKPVEQMLVHGGELDTTWSGVRVVPWGRVQELPWCS